VDPAAFRSEFPVCERVAYLNAGTCGPLPRAAVDALAAEVQRAAADGRGRAYIERLKELAAELRGAYAATLHADPADVALTTATSEGIVRVLLALPLRAGDEVLIAEREHPGLLGPLAAARDRLGLEVRAVPLGELPGAVGPRTRLVACSHVAWTDGALAPALDGLPDDVPVLLDGAQAAGAIGVDVDALGCAFYAASGQKWLCGPVGTGMLWVSPAWRERLRPTGPTYVNLDDPSRGLDAPPWPDARAHDAAAISVEALAVALASHEVLAGYGWGSLHDRALGLAGALAERLGAAGRDVAPRGPTTLVSWRSDDPETEVGALAEAGVLVRGFAGLPWIRASVGAWNDEDDLDRLIGALPAAR
jgi:L-cysteine/cystine lyase